jgi:hypothetical protein
MKKIYVLIAIISLPAVLLVYANSSGSQGGYTGSPGDNGNTCTTCHTGNQVIEQEGWITTDIPAEGYTPGMDYTITLTGMHENVQKFGFEMTVEDIGNSKVGEFTILDDRTQFAAGSNQRVTHTSNGNVPSGDSNTWDVTWTAPSEGVGSVTFYAALNAANGNGNTLGDQIYTTMLEVNESSLGVGVQELADQIRMYPNPASTSLNLQLPENGQVRIIDMLGNQVIESSSTLKDQNIDVSNLTKGIYFVQVMIGNEVVSLKMLKN